MTTTEAGAPLCARYPLLLLGLDYLRHLALMSPAELDAHHTQPTPDDLAFRVMASVTVRHLVDHVVRPAAHRTTVDEHLAQGSDAVARAAQALVDSLPGMAMIVASEPLEIDPLMKSAEWLKRQAEYEAHLEASTKAANGEKRQFEAYNAKWRRIERESEEAYTEFRARSVINIPIGTRIRGTEAPPVMRERAQARREQRRGSWHPTGVRIPTPSHPQEA